MPFPTPPQLRRFRFRMLTPGAAQGLIAQVPPGVPPQAVVTGVGGLLAGLAGVLPFPPPLLGHVGGPAGKPRITAITAIPVPDGSPARMVIVVRYPGESFFRGGHFALAYHPGMVQPRTVDLGWGDIWSDDSTYSLLLKKHGSHGLRITQVPVGWYDRRHTHPSEHRREGKRRPRYVAVARKARKAAKRQARYTARYGGKYPPVDPSLQAHKLRGYLPTSDLPPAIQARKLRGYQYPNHTVPFTTDQLRGSGPIRIPVALPNHKVPFNTDSNYVAFTQSVDPKTGGPWSGSDPWALPGPGLPPKFSLGAAVPGTGTRIPYQYAEQGGQGPYDPVGIYASGGRRPGIYGQDEVPESDGPSLMYLGVAGALGWLVGRL